VGPAVRCIMALVYTFAAIARLNKDYHNMRRSSGSVLMLLVADRLASAMQLPTKLVDKLGDWVVTSLLRVSLVAVEVIGLVIPVLLWRGPVTWALALIWVQQFVLSTVTAFDFSCLLVASLPFWVPPQRLLALQWMTVSPVSRSLGLAMAVALLGSMLLQRSQMQRRVHITSVICLAAACPLQYAGVMKEGFTPTFAPVTVCGRAVIAPFFVREVARITVFLAILNGICPYLGLRTQSTWSLFSNLRVEGGSTNHLLFPASWQVFGYTRDCVLVTRTNVPALRQHHTVAFGTSKLTVFKNYAERAGVNAAIHSGALLDGDGNEENSAPYLVPFFQLRSIVSVQIMPLLPNFYVEYSHYGAPHRFEVRNGAPLRGSDLRLAVSPPPLLRKLLAFRTVPGDDANGVCCQ